MGKKPCWEYMQCPDSRMADCRAFIEDRGTECWVVTGTMCRGEEQPSVSAKIAKCRTCDYYKYIVFEEEKATS
jgi:methyl-accepting chemotaxis protein